MWRRVGLAVMMLWFVMPQQQPAGQTGQQLIWFTPNVGGDTPDFVPPQDIYELFEPDAPWSTAKGSIQVFKFYIDSPREVPNLPLQKAIQALAAANIAIAVEAGGLRKCSGARMAEIELQKLAPFIQAGGQLRYLALDRAFGLSIAGGEENTCNLTVQQAADQLLLYVKGIRKQLPDVKIGLIEPVSWYTVGDFPNYPGANYGDLPQLLDTVLSVLRQGGETLDFFHADSPYDYVEGTPNGQGWAKLKALQDFVHSQGLRFGLIYNSERGGNTSDELFYRDTLAAKGKFAQAGGDPDDIILQSWYWHPRQWLPEDQPYSYTYLVKEFIKRQVPVINMSVGTPAPDGSAQVTGTLSDLKTGAPVGNAPIEFFATSLSGKGAYQEYTITDTVPAGATEANVGFRVNDECGCSGTSDFFLYEMRYAEGSETDNRVPNGNFSKGMQGWGFWGTGEAQLGASDRGSGKMLHVQATASQSASINTDSFAVTPGATYKLTVAARVAPISKGSGYFAVFFLNPSTELRRDTIPLDAVTVSAGQRMTGANGEFQLTLSNLSADQVLLEAQFQGNDQYVPTNAEITVGAGVLDSDGDGVPDDKDFCPTFPGKPEANGC